METSLLETCYRKKKTTEGRLLFHLALVVYLIFSNKIQISLDFMIISEHVMCAIDEAFLYLCNESCLGPSRILEDRYIGSFPADSHNGTRKDRCFVHTH